MTIQRGFTLIELLVVIAIIGMLASITLASLNGVRAKARDARRLSDLRQIRTALELYANDHGSSYPVGNATTCNATGWYWCTSYGGSATWAWLASQLSPYISTLPVDPNNTGDGGGPWNVGDYVYGYISNGTTYDLVGQLENTGSPNRCGIVHWKWHTGGEADWCGGYTTQLVADH